MTERSALCHVLVSGAGGGRESAARTEIRAFSTCRNERLRLPAFLRHYRRLGVNRFFIIDNDSYDGTTEYLASQPDVRMFRTTSRHGDSNSGATWLNALLDEWGVGSWCVTVDIDELLVYPGAEDAPLRALTAYFDQNGYDALSCMLLDLYPAQPLRDCSYSPGDDLVAAAPYFDVGPYQRTPVDSCPGVLIRGGMRERLFYPEFRARGLLAKLHDALLYRIALRTRLVRDARWLRARQRPVPPCLTKVPLIRWDRKSRYLSGTHFVAPKAVAPDTGVLLHFKFLQDFHARVVEEIPREEYWAAEHRRYRERLSQNPDLTLLYEGSTRYEGTAQLVRLGLMRDTEVWAKARDGGVT
jgi:hypothetical protein